ncbi:MAG: phospho-sugar mutase [Candidatus Izemoplasma sp.]|nr:phospho-sugar mutase [Candidatus Izemoplasma sp.]
MMKNIIERWKSYSKLDKDLKTELEGMNEEALQDAFYKDLEFGTGGMRGKIGPGTNRMNIYTIRKANLGFAQYLLEQSDSPSVVIAHDNRHKSKEFAKESACVLAQQGIHVYLFDGLRPTPELSFAVRELDATGGIVVTASHNPPEYNGYKIYDQDGCQLVPKYADQVIANVNAIEDVFDIESLPFETARKKGFITIIGDAIDQAYIKSVLDIQLSPNMDKTIKIVFTPLHGTSARIGLDTLTVAGYDVYPVTEQMTPDPNFSTVDSPNPENKEAFNMAIEKGKEVDADLLIATDPDADRLGIAVKHNKEYQLLTGNQTGAILVHYLLKKRQEQGTLPQKGMVYNTIVTSEFGATIAKDFGMDVKSTLTGFKFIGEQAKLIEDTDYEFVFGYEESYGYVIQDFVRDKDSIQALLLASEVAQAKALEGKTLYDYLLELYETYGYYYEDLVNIRLEGKSGEERITNILSTFREEKPQTIAGKTVVQYEDYLTQEGMKDDQSYRLELPKSNVLKFFLDDGSWFVLRPSGTEPKLKIYIGVVGDDLAHAKTLNEDIKRDVLALINNI